VTARRRRQATLFGETLLGGSPAKKSRRSKGECELRKVEIAENLSREAEARMTRESSALMSRIAIWRGDPIAFIADCFHETPDEQQAEVLRALPHYARIAVRSGNGCGKTWLATRAALWFFLVHPGAKVVVTAPTWRQVERVFWAELHAGVHRTLLPRWIEFSRTTAALRIRRSARLVPSESWFIIGLSSDAPENFQGFHGPHILFIIDEASGVADEVFDAMEGNRASGNARILVTGNPTRASGRFFDIFHDNDPGWRRFHFTGLKSRWVSPAWIDEKRRDWGESSDLYRVRVLGEFPRAGANALFSRDAVDAAFNTAPSNASEGSFRTRGTACPAQAEAFTFAGIDVARFGDDFTVLTVLRQEPDGSLVLQYLRRWHRLPLTALAQALVDALSKWSPRIVCVDDTGVGGGLTDLLKERNLRVRPVVFAAQAPENLLRSPARAVHGAPTACFANLKAALAWRLRSELEEGRFSVAPEVNREDRDRIAHQLLGITYRFTDSGRLLVEDAPGKSPDEAHSLMIALAALDRAPAPRIAIL